MSRLQDDPLGDFVPGTCVVPWHLRCATSRRTKLLASADGQRRETARKVLKRALSLSRQKNRRAIQQPADHFFVYRLFGDISRYSSD